MDSATDHSDLIARLFTVLTVRCEEGAGIAAQGQSQGLPAARHREFAHRLEDIGQEIAAVAQAAAALSDSADTPSTMPLGSRKKR